MSSHQHHRHSSAFSTASAFRTTSRSPSPSPSAVSPVSPILSPGDEGLSRRHSWSRNEPSTRMTESRLHPLAQVPTNSTTASRHQLRAGHDEFDLGMPALHHRPFDNQYPSETSLASEEIGSSQSDLDLGSKGRKADDDLQYLSPGTSTLPYSTPPRRPYDASGQARTSGPSRLAASVGRSSTLRSVSRTLRKASVRVVNIMGKEREDGLARLPDDDGEYEDNADDTKKDGSIEMVPTPADRPRPQPMPPEFDGLRGRTLGVFGPRSSVRRAMDALMRNPFAEPVILLLIIANVVFLTIQAAPTLNSPRPGDGYFHSWEDFALLGLFIVFTLEMFARIVVTGLVLDPETSTRQFWFGSNGVVPTIEARLGKRENALQRSLSQGTPRRAAWRDREGSTEALKSANIGGVAVEAPFHQAVAKQHALSAAGRPYLRHSWHRIDMLAVICYWITFALAMAGLEATANRHTYIFRALSVLRAGRLLVITSGTTTILHSLKRAGPMLVTVAFYVVFAVILFSIIGVQSFRGSFRRSCILTDPNNGTNEINLEQLCGGHINASTLLTDNYLDEDGTPSSAPPKGYICPLGQVCQVQSENPEGNAMSFDNIFYSLLQVTIIASINSWSDGMFGSMDTDYFGSCLYFLVGVIVINFWMINLVVAVVVNTFKDIRASTKRSAFGAEQTVLRADGQWGTDRRDKGNRLLQLYQKTRWFWVLLVFVDLVSQACKTSDSAESTLSLLRDPGNLELAFTLAFDVEIVIRIAGHLPEWQGFFNSGHHNSFDLFLAIVTTIIQIPPIPSTNVYNWLTIFQLMRWYRVVVVVPRMRPLLVMVFGSFAGLLNLVFFLLLVTLIASLVAVQLLRGDIPEGDTMTFSQTWNSFLGMYQVFSSEDWTDVLFGAMSGSERWKQKWIAAIFLCGWLLFSFFILLQMFIAVINENFAVAEEQKRKEQIEAFIRKSEPASAHVSWIDRLNPYRLMKAHHHSVKVETLPPNLVLPLKQNVGMDVGSGPNPSDELDNTSKSKKAMRRMFGLETTDPSIHYRSLHDRRSVRIEDLEDMDDTRGLTDLLPPLNTGPSVDEHMDALREKRNHQADFIAAHPSFDHSLWIFKQSHPIRRFCQACVPPAYGDRIFGRRPNPVFELVMRSIVLAAVVASVAVAAIATPLYRKDYYADNGIQRGTWFNLTEVALGMVLVAEAGIKIIADGFIFAPNAYLLSIWNIMDSIVLITLLINTTTSLIFIGGLSRVTRALKSFRALRLITLFSRQRDTLHAVLFAGALKILDASVLTILYLVPFAVWGLNIFSGLLYSCNDGSVTGKDQCVGMYLASPVDASLAYLVPRVWSNPQEVGATHFSFDSFRASILVLFEIISLEGWIDVMSAAMAIVGLDEQPDDLNSQWNSIFFLTFHLLGGCVILALFVSIIIENFSSRSGTALLTAAQRRWVDLQKFIKAQSPSQLPKSRPQDGFRSWCYDRATQKSGYWARGFTAIYYIHIILLMTEDYSSNVFTDAQADIVFLFLTCLYAFDLLVRLYGLGLKSFRANGWNLFDVIVISGSFATTIPALYVTLSDGQPNQVNVQLQKLFLVSIAFKLVQRVSSLNQLFKTSVASLPAIGNLFLLWATLFIFFSILYMEVFGLTKAGGSAYTRFQNYYTFGNSLVMLAFMSTGEGWNGYMHNYKVAYPLCTENENYFDSDCGSPSWAYGLFISWNIISMYIFMNMFTGVVVESFAYVYQRPGGVSVNREDIRAFKKIWSSIDTERTGYIKRKDFIRFFSRLSGVFEVRLYPAEYSVPNLLRATVPDPFLNASGKLVTATGVKTAVDIGKLQQIISHIDYARVRARRQTFARLYNEARISEEPGRGIGFTAMLLLLAHHKLIDDEEALQRVQQLDDLLMRRAKKERVTDLVNFDRVRGFLRTIYWRRKFLAHRDERRRLLSAEAGGEIKAPTSVPFSRTDNEGIPAIVLEPTPASPPMDDGENPFDDDSRSLAPSPSPPQSPDRSPELRASTWQDGRAPPSLSVSVSSQPRQRKLSSGSMLSSDDAHHRHSPSLDGTEDDQGAYDSMANSMWGDMMREADDREDQLEESVDNHEDLDDTFDDKTRHDET